MSRQEIFLFEDLIKRDDIKYDNIESALNLAETVIGTTQNYILYIINIPITKIVNCNIIQLVPTRNNISINYEKMKCNDKLLGIRNECKNYNKLK